MAPEARALERQALEDYRNAVVTKALAQLQQGDRYGAEQTLFDAGIDPDFYLH